MIVIYENPIKNHIFAMLCKNIAKNNDNSTAL